MQCQEISHAEFNLIILGQLQAFGNNSTSVSVESRHKANSRYVRTLPITIKESKFACELPFFSILSKFIADNLRKATSCVSRFSRMPTSGKEDISETAVLTLSGKSTSYVTPISSLSLVPLEISVSVIVL